MADHYDVIVIGSGAGRGTLTHALATTGKRILLLGATARPTACPAHAPSAPMREASAANHPSAAVPA